MRNGRTLGLVRRREGTNGWTPRCEDFVLWERAVALEAETGRPAHVDRDAVSVHIPDGLTVVGLIVRNNHADKVSSLTHLPKRAPKQLEEDVRTVAAVAGGSLIKKRSSLRWIFIKRPMFMLGGLRVAAGCDYV